MNIHRTNAEAEIRAAIEDWAAAFRRKDADAVMAHGAPGHVAFTLAPPLVQADDGPDGLVGWFDTWEGPLEFEMRDLVVVAGDEVAFTHSLNRMGGNKKGQGPVSLWFRSTMGFRKLGGSWKIAHEHESVPFYMDGSLRAAVDLKP